MLNFAPGNKIETNMARPKKEKRESSFVTLRTKPVSKGRLSYYLDIYKDGKRSYEFLKLYLVPETSPAAKVQNQNTEQAAKAIRNQREIDIIQGKGGIKQNGRGGKTLLLDWLEYCMKEAEENSQSNSVAINTKVVKVHVKAYKGENTRLADIDEEWCKGFIKYLSSAQSHNHKDKKTIKHSSANIYFGVFVSALNRAVKDGLISNNPTKNLDKHDRKPIKADKSNRPYLTIDELKAMIATDCKRNNVVKQAFLFACFTGLRISDIRNLKWQNIISRNGNKYISIVMQKTRHALPEIKLNDQALKWLPKKQGTDNVFNISLSTKTLNYNIDKWAKRAGITKRISFHVSRHTFATLALTKGASLYVVSNMLGHENIKTTQIYADIIGKDRDEALDKLADGF